MAKVLDERPKLRVLPMVTYGLSAMSKTCSTSRASTVANHVGRRARRIHPPKEHLHISKNGSRFVCKFYINEVHVYVRPEIRTLEDLAGKKVSFNTVGSAANLTGGILFRSPSRHVEKVFINNSIALEKMRTGEIAGCRACHGKPTDLFTKFKPEPGFTSWKCRFRRNLLDYYVPTKLTSTDYPNLIRLANPWKRSGCRRCWLCITGLPTPTGIAASPASWNISSIGSTSSKAAVHAKMEGDQLVLFAPAGPGFEPQKSCWQSSRSNRGRALD